MTYYISLYKTFCCEIHHLYTKHDIFHSRIMHLHIYSLVNDESLFQNKSDYIHNLIALATILLREI